MVQVTEVYRKAADICIYMPINNEVDVKYIADGAWKEGKGVWLPKTIDGSIEFYRYEKDGTLISGTFGIQEPVSADKLTPDGSTLVIMPGAVFSEKHDRIGYGGGYYDRFLAKNPECRTMAVCYEFQIVPELPSEPHDIRPEVIVSEERVMMR